MKQLGALLVVVGLLAVGCGGTATVSDSDLDATQRETAEQADQVEPTVAQVEPTAPPAPTPEPEPTARPTAEPEPSAVPAAAGLFDEVETGSCFNDGDSGQSIVPVDCNGEHENEIFMLSELPDGRDAPFRDDQAFSDELYETICDDATIEFAGIPWDEVPFRVAALSPSAESWAGGDRTVACVAQSGLADRPTKIGTAAGGDLTSDDGIVARSSVDGQSDFHFSFQASTLYPLTSGEFDLPANTPQVDSIGFQFGSREQGAESGAQAWVYLFDEGEATRLETGLPDSWEVASVHFVTDLPAFMFSARENEDDDWEIYLSSTDGGTVALTDNTTDDEFPSLTPDESQILWSADGDIWIMDVDGTNQTQLTDGPGEAFETQMAPDGSTILFTSTSSGNEDVWSMAADGSNQVNLTNHPANDSWPFFSEDGSIVYFQTGRIGVNAIVMMMEPDGSNQSYFSFEFLTNAALLPDTVTERFKDELTAIGELPDEPDEADGEGGLSEGDVGLVPGSPDELNELEHSLGRIFTALPGGWEFRERGGASVASLVAAPSLEAFDERWDTLGVTFTVLDFDSAADLLELADLAPAAEDSSCTEDSDSTETEGELTTTVRRYSCGRQGQAVVVAVFDSEDSTGLVFEGQWPDDADGDANADLIGEISAATRWG